MKLMKQDKMNYDKIINCVTISLHVTMFYGLIIHNKLLFYYNDIPFVVVSFQFLQYIIVKWRKLESGRKERKFFLLFIHIILSA
jgi:hypothetical protein